MWPRDAHVRNSILQIFSQGRNVRHGAKDTLQRNKVAGVCRITKVFIHWPESRRRSSFRLSFSVESLAGIWQELVERVVNSRVSWEEAL